MEIYCLKLESNKYFLHVSECGCSQNNKSDEDILLNAEIYYSYLQKYKPISIIKKIKIENIIEVDSHVKQYMMEYGIDNVRGGSYSEEKICDSNVSHELQHYNRHHDKTRDLWVNHLLSDISVNKKPTMEEIAFKKHDLENTLEKYKRKKRELETISIEGSQIIEDIQWIKEVCSRNIQIYNTTNQNKTFQQMKIKNNEIKNKYRKVLASLNQIYTIFCSFSFSSIFIIDIHVKYPHFLLDDFFYHWHHIHLEGYVEEVERVCFIYEDMTNKITQKMKEIESILETYDDDLEWKIPRELYLLHKQLEDPSLKQM